ncbi:MAG: M4 family metallopeptidase [Candidatus Methanoperedens sp.]|nr:M4 family metallopeptidase [Candidatus Methanoperedens sp.]
MCKNMCKNTLEKMCLLEEGRAAGRKQEQMYGRVPAQCILPPHMLNEIAKKGNPKQRDMALKTLLMSEKIRGRREAFAEVYVAMSLGAKCTRVYDAKNGQDLPGEEVNDPENSSDPAVKEAHNGANATYDMYLNAFERNSIDDKGMCILSSVHFDEKYDNAFWDGRQMVYGDGDGELFNRFTISIDVIGHELTHGVTEYEAGLVYYDQPGALNESMSDVFGSLVKQRVLNQTAEEADWLIGEGLFTSKVKGKALRSMKEPGTAYDDPVLGKDPQSAHMRDYKRLPRREDSGGVHINSGIPNRAFCITAMEIGGHAWEKAGKIWYIALRDRLRYNSGFQAAANKTFQIAGVMFGTGSEEQNAVKKGWTEVGITPKAR